MLDYRREETKSAKEQHQTNIKNWKYKKKTFVSFLTFYFDPFASSLYAAESDVRRREENIHSFPLCNVINISNISYSLSSYHSIIISQQWLRFYNLLNLNGATFRNVYREIRFSMFPLSRTTRLMKFNGPPQWHQRWFVMQSWNWNLNCNFKGHSMLWYAIADVRLKRLSSASTERAHFICIFQDFFMIVTPLTTFYIKIFMSPVMLTSLPDVPTSLASCTWRNSFAFCVKIYKKEREILIWRHKVSVRNLD